MEAAIVVTTTHDYCADISSRLCAVLLIAGEVSPFHMFQSRIVAVWAILLCGYRDMDRIDIAIKIQ